MGFFVPRKRTSRVTFKWSWRTAFLLLVVMLFLLFLLIQSPFVQKTMYPVEYTEEVEISARAFDVDPFLILAIIRVESNFSPDVSSHKGAHGLMQLMPETVEWMVSDGHFERSFLDRIGEPAANIHMGSWYIGQLMHQFKGKPIAAIAAYNAGPGRVATWLKEKRWDGEEESIKAIPFGETRKYVKKVLYYYEKYREIHHELEID
ncbi:lytic transglycosylase domain-containing protein [Numidum massiliense]|uniref:lytic transglycosylase domain-containing protein n=1 Tax=Numidum massiliense TaxID=1522315 RepID=UPI0006D52E61|nr:lytic transglycosylase domain-containing protein [Numidum massiliense]